MNRITSACVIALTTFMITLPCWAKNGNVSHPNVLFIAIDDLNDWVEGLEGHLQVKTPHITRLAKRGVLFTNAHCQAPICMPSRTSLLTGTYPWRNGVYMIEQELRSARVEESGQRSETFGHKEAIGPVRS